MSYKSKKVTRPTLIDPLFQIPEGAEEEFVYDKDISQYTNEEFFERNGLNQVSSPFGVLYSSSGETINPSNITPPNNVVVFDQRIRRNAGTVVVDVTVDFDDVQPAARYEMRLTKI